MSAMGDLYRKVTGADYNGYKEPVVYIRAGTEGPNRDSDQVIQATRLINEEIRSSIHAAGVGLDGRPNADGTRLTRRSQAKETEISAIILEQKHREYAAIVAELSASVDRITREVDVSKEAQDILKRHKIANDMSNKIRPLVRHYYGLSQSYGGKWRGKEGLGSEEVRKEVLDNHKSPNFIEKAKEDIAKKKEDLKNNPEQEPSDNLPKEPMPDYIPNDNNTGEGYDYSALKGDTGQDGPPVSGEGYPIYDEGYFRYDEPTDGVPGGEYGHLADVPPIDDSYFDGSIQLDSDPDDYYAPSDYDEVTNNKLNLIEGSYSEVVNPLANNNQDYYEKITPEDNPFLGDESPSPSREVMVINNEGRPEPVTLESTYILDNAKDSDYFINRNLINLNEMAKDDVASRRAELQESGSDITKREEIEIAASSINKNSIAFYGMRDRLIEGLSMSDPGDQSEEVRKTRETLSRVEGIISKVDFSLINLNEVGFKEVERKISNVAERAVELPGGNIEKDVDNTIGNDEYPAMQAFMQVYKATKASSEAVSEKSDGFFRTIINKLSFKKDLSSKEMPEASAKSSYEGPKNPMDSLGNKASTGAERSNQEVKAPSSDWASSGP